MMRKRLQVVIDESEFKRYQRAARKEGMSLSEWGSSVPASRLARRRDDASPAGNRRDTRR